MRLYLSSHRLGEAPGELVALMRGRTRIGVIANAADHLEPGKRESRLQREQMDLEDLGLEADEVDLRQHFDDRDRRPPDLEGYDALWVLGGDVIALRTAFHASGADAVITGRLREDSLVYAGYSAGACILGPRDALAGASFRGRLPGYPVEPVSTGLGILPFAIVPHYEGDAGGLAGDYVNRHIPFIALRDGQAVVMDGDSTRVG